MGDGKVPAVDPTSAMICCRIHAQPRDGRQTLDGLLLSLEQTRHLLIELLDLLVDQSHFVQRHVEQPSVDRVRSVHAPSASRN